MLYTDHCQKCGKSFTSPVSWLDHFYTVNCDPVDPENPFTSHCETCGESFTNDTAHAAHRCRKASLACNVCHRQFSNRGCLTNHEKVHSKKRKAPASHRGEKREKQARIDASAGAQKNEVPIPPLQLHLLPKNCHLYTLLQLSGKRQLYRSEIMGLLPKNHNQHSILKLRGGTGGPGGDLLGFYAERRQTLLDQIAAFKKTHKDMKFLVKVMLDFEAYDTKNQRVVKHTFDFATQEILVLEQNTEDYMRCQLDNSMFNLHEASLKVYDEWIKSLETKV